MYVKLEGKYDGFVKDRDPENGKHILEYYVRCGWPFPVPTQTAWILHSDLLLLGPRSFPLFRKGTNTTPTLGPRLRPNRKSRTPSRKSYSENNYAKFMPLEKLDHSANLELFACARVHHPVHPPKKTTKICVDQGRLMYRCRE